MKVNRSQKEREIYENDGENGFVQVSSFRGWRSWQDSIDDTTNSTAFC